MSLTSGPLISVITPAYNRGNYLEETIESVFNQTYKSIEYLVLDDGSTDNTREVLAQYDGRLKWESHPNMGETRTVNKGFAWATGKYITVVNSDDPILPDLFATAVEYLECHPEVLMVYPAWLYIDQDSQVMGKVACSSSYPFVLVIDNASNSNPRREGLEFDYLNNVVRAWACIVGPGAVFRQSVLSLVPGRDPRYRYVADLDFWLRLGLHGPCAFLNADLATHRFHPGSAGIALSPKVGHELVQLAQEFFRRPDLPREVRRLRSAALCAAATQAIQYCETDPEAVRKYRLLAEFSLGPVAVIKGRLRKAIAAARMRYSAYRAAVRPLVARLRQRMSAYRNRMKSMLNALAKMGPVRHRMSVYRRKIEPTVIAAAKMEPVRHQLLVYRGRIKPTLVAVAKKAPGPIRRRGRRLLNKLRSIQKGNP